MTTSGSEVPPSPDPATWRATTCTHWSSAGGSTPVAATRMTVASAAQQFMPKRVTTTGPTRPC